MIVCFIVGWIFSSSSRQITQNRVDEMLQGTIVPLPTSTPTPTIAFDLSQQCLNDANNLVDSKQQEEDKVWQIAHQYHTGYTSFTVHGSSFSSRLNTCVAEIDETLVQDNLEISTDYIYDTTKNKLLAQCPIASDGNCGRSSFIDPLQSGYPLKENFNWADWSDYKIAIGL